MDGKGMERLRKKHGIRRSSFARWAKLHYNTVFKWERDVDRRPPDWGVQLLLSYINMHRQEADREHQAS